MLATAKHEALTFGFPSTLLLPMRVTKAFKESILVGAAELYFCDARLVFFEGGVPRINVKEYRKRGKLVADSALFDSIVVRYKEDTPPDATPKIGIWHVPKHVSATDLERARMKLIAPMVQVVAEFKAAFEADPVAALGVLR